jgi:hypothetical protein
MTAFKIVPAFRRWRISSIIGGAIETLQAAGFKHKRWRDSNRIRTRRNAYDDKLCIAIHVLKRYVLKFVFGRSTKAEFRRPNPILTQPKKIGGK